jgi:hypothetical protein
MGTSCDGMQRYWFDAVPGTLDSRNLNRNLLRRLCIKCQIYVPSLPNVSFSPPVEIFP